MFFRRKKPEKQQPKAKSDLPKNNIGLPDLSSGIALDEEVIREYLKNNSIQVGAPIPASVKSTAMDAITSYGMFPVQSYGQVNQRILAYYVASSSFIGYYACALIAQHWLVNKGCSFKVRKAVRNWFEITDCSGGELDARQIKFIETCDKEYKLRQNLIQAVHFNNVFGIRHILFKHKNPDYDYSLPFNPDSFGPGDYAGMSQIDPYWVTPELNDEDLTDPTRIGFYEPTYWIINGRRYHKSHFVILYGEEVADYLKPTYRYGGLPLVQRVYERIYAAESTANESPILAKTKRLSVQKLDTAKIQANKAQFIKNLNTMAQLRDNYNVYAIDRNDEFMQIDTSLSDLEDVIMNQYQLVCSQFDAPASELLGTGHNGFSTGETDDDYQIQSCEEVQRNQLNQIIDAHYARLTPAEITPKLGITPILEPVWNPMKVMSAAEIADIRVKNSQADVNWFNTGSIDNVDIRDRLSKDKNSGFEGLQMPDQIVEDPEQVDEESQTDEEEQTANDEAIALDYLQESDGKWYVYSEEGKRLSKGYGSKEEAQKRLGEIEAFKHMDK